MNSIPENFKILIQSESQQIYPPALCTGFMVFKRESIDIVIDLIRITDDFPYLSSDQKFFNEYVFANNLLDKEIHVLAESVFSNGLHWLNFLNRNQFSNINIQTKSIDSLMFHANFLVGLDAKKKMLIQLGLWNLNIGNNL